MLSAAGLASGHAGTAKSKTIGLVPPPIGAGKIRSPLPPPPNDTVVVRKTSASQGIALKVPKENANHSADPLSDLSQLEVLFYLHFNELHMPSTGSVFCTLWHFCLIRNNNFQEISLDSHRLVICI